VCMDRDALAALRSLESHRRSRRAPRCRLHRVAGRVAARRGERSATRALGVARCVDAAFSAPEPSVCRCRRTVARRRGQSPRQPARLRQPRGGDCSERLIEDGRRRTGAAHGARDRFDVPHRVDEPRRYRAETWAYD
jgi:hypothetical protein